MISTRARLIPIASAPAAILGAYEGTLYPQGGPSMPLFVFWSLMLLLLALSVLGTLTLARVPHPALHALALLPLALVVQDAASLIAQGSSPARADWYAGVFGDHFLTQHVAGYPGFYWVCLCLTLVFLNLIPALGARASIHPSVGGPKYVTPRTQPPP